MLCSIRLILHGSCGFYTHHRFPDFPNGVGRGSIIWRIITSKDNGRDLVVACGRSSNYIRMDRLFLSLDV